MDFLTAFDFVPRGQCALNKSSTWTPHTHGPRSVYTGQHRNVCNFMPHSSYVLSVI